MRSSTRRWLRVSLVLVGALSGLALAELGLRVLDASAAVGDAQGLHEPRPDRAWLYGLRPGAVRRVPTMGDVVYRVNAHGFRDRAREPGEHAGRHRTLVLGDSIAFGFGVELDEAFPAQLEESLARLAPEHAPEVLNLGVSGYNPYTEAALLEDVAASWQPDLVLVQFSINDLGDPTLGFDLHTRLELGAIPDEAYPDAGLRETPERPPGIALRLCQRLRLCVAFEGVFRASATPGFTTPKPPAGDPAWAWLETQYARMAAAAERSGAAFAVVVFPAREQVAGIDGPVPEQIRALGARRGWPVVDLLPAFRRAERGEAPLFLDLWHPTPLGHRVAARASAAALACSGTLPVAPPAACASAR